MISYLVQAAEVTHPMRRKIDCPISAPAPMLGREDPASVASEAGLRYVHDQMPGMRRKRAGRGFRYMGTDGQPIHDPRILARIKHLAIPPAWTDVWICPDPAGHIQATGYDAKGRKQYRYHDRWRVVRDETKFARMVAFGEALPIIRARVAHDLALPGLPHDKILATVVRLLDVTAIRIGNEEYAREHAAYGLTTLQQEHVEVKGSTLHFHFTGKSGKHHDIACTDKRLARILKKLEDLPGQELFQYIDEDGATRSVLSDDVNAYLHDITQQPFTTKDFRTWIGTVCAAQALKACGSCATKTQEKREITAAIKLTAARLGNTPAVCRKSYVHPGILDAYRANKLAISALKQDQAQPSGLDEQEIAVLRLLKQWEREREASETPAERTRAG